MKNFILFTCLLFLYTSSFCQEGIYFEPLTFEQAKAKAKAEKKLIFMDCYTSWCGPCKYMTEQVFTHKEAGTYFNPRFISVKFDMEKGEGKILAKRFPISAYPTFFIIRPDGSIQHTIVGGGPLDIFIDRVEKGVHVKTSLDYLQKQYKKGKLSKKQMMEYITILNQNQNYEKSKQISQELETRLTYKDRVKKEFWPLIESKNYGDPEFQFVLNHLSVLQKNIGEETLDHYLQSRFLVPISQCRTKQGEATQQQLEKIRQELSLVEFKSKENLIDKLLFAEACAQENIDSIITLTQKMSIQPFSNDDLWFILSPYLNWMDKKGNKKQFYEAANLLDSLALKTQDKNMKTKLSHYAESFKILAYQGIFFHDLSFDEAKQKAQKENKMLFIDCYTRWCGPCMYMTNTIFKEEALGDFMNKQFICVKYDLETEKGSIIQKQYNVQVYPTFIILNPDGSLRHQFVGGGNSSKFLQKVKDGLDDRQSLSALNHKYNNGCRDKEFLTLYLNKLTELYSPQAIQVALDLFQQLNEEEKLSKNYWFLTGNIDIAPKDSEIGKYVLENRTKFFQTIGEEEVNNRLLNSYMKEVMMILYGKMIQTSPENLDKISRQITALHLKNNQVYQAYIKIAKAKLSNDIDHFISVCEKEYSKEFNKKVLYNMEGVGNNATSAQKKRWNDFLKKISSK